MDLPGELGPEELRLADRIRTAVRAAGGPSAIAERSGIPLSSLNKYVRGAISPSAVVLERIAGATDRPISYFLGPESAVSDHDTPNKASHLPDDDIVRIPILDVSAGAGSGIDNDGTEIVAYLPFPVGFLRRLGIKPEHVRGVRSRGDSMEPTIGDKMLVLINTAVADLHDGEIYGIRAADGMRLKRIQRHIDGSVTLISDNRDKYLPETLSAEEAMNVEVAGHAFWTERLL